MAGCDIYFHCRNPSGYLSIIVAPSFSCLASSSCMAILVYHLWFGRRLGFPLCCGASCLSIFLFLAGPCKCGGRLLSGFSVVDLLAPCLALFLCWCFTGLFRLVWLFSPLTSGLAVISDLPCVLMLIFWTFCAGLTPLVS